MGQAKLRDSKEERIAQSQAKNSHQSHAYILHEKALGASWLKM